MRPFFFVGLDLGQSHDYTALAVLERREERGQWDPVHFAHTKTIVLRLRQSVRLPLGTSYPTVADRVHEAVERLRDEGSVKLAVDATGVGRAVTDLLRDKGLAGNMWPVVVTGGQREHSRGDGFTVPKKDLMAAVKVLLEQRKLRIASQVREKAALLREFQEFGVRDGHDDLLFAVALACWAAKKMYPVEPSGANAWFG